jgi:hypothetical protein
MSKITLLTSMADGPTRLMAHTLSRFPPEMPLAMRPDSQRGNRPRPVRRHRLGMRIKRDAGTTSERQYRST